MLSSETGNDPYRTQTSMQRAVDGGRRDTLRRKETRKRYETGHDDMEEGEKNNRRETETRDKE